MLMPIPPYLLLALLSQPSDGSAPLTAPVEAEAAPAPFAAYTPSPRAQEEHFDFTYTYVELGFAVLDIDDFDEDSDSIYGRASLGLFDLLYVFLDYQNSSSDFEDTDSDLWGLGAGAHFDVSDRLDLQGEASWLTADVESDLDDLDDSNDGWTAYAGARYLALPWNRGGLEVNGGYRWIDLEGYLSDDEVSAWLLGGRVHFLRLFSVGAKYTFLEDDSQWGIDARVSFF